jgi:hypothetical protein
MRTCNRWSTVLLNFDVDQDPDQNVYFDAVADPDPAFHSDADQVSGLASQFDPRSCGLDTYLSVI